MFAIIFNLIPWKLVGPICLGMMLALSGGYWLQGRTIDGLRHDLQNEKARSASLAGDNADLLRDRNRDNAIDNETPDERRDRLERLGRLFETD